MRDSWICRDYQSGDEYQILTLYKEANNREMDLMHWRWKFTENPFGKGIIKLMFDGNKLAGHYAITPVELQVGNRIVKAGFSLNTMTHPDYGKQGVFTHLAEQVYKQCRQEDYALVYGFPNANSYYGFTEKLDWIGFGKMSVWQKKLQENTSVLPNINEVDRFDNRVDLLWEKVGPSYDIIVPRTRDFLNWRFVNHPTRIYSTFIITGDSGEVLGYLVLKTYAKEGKPEGHIVDMLCIPSKHVVKSLLEHTYGYFFKRGIRDVSCWIPDNCFITQVLCQEGFTMKESTTNFGVKVFANSSELSRDAKKFNNWCLTMGDSDVF